MDYRTSKMGERLTVERLKKIAKMSQTKKNENVLDVGCGNKAILKYLGAGINYIGIDSLDSADIKYDLGRGLPKLKEKFDLIIISAILEEIENFKTLIGNCVKVLKPNGRIIIATPSPNRFLWSEHPVNIHCFRKTNIKNLATLFGLQIDKIVGDAIHIPKLNFVIPTNQSFYSNFIIYQLSKK